ELDTGQAAAIALRALDAPRDRWLDYALWWTVRRLGPRWIPRLRAGDASFASEPRHLEFALQSVDSPAVVDPLFTVLDQPGITRERAVNVARLIGSLGDPRQLGRLFTIALESDGTRQFASLRGLVLAAQRGRPRPVGNLSDIAGVLTSGVNDARRSLGAELIGRWKIDALRPALVNLASKDNGLTDALRGASFEAIARMGGDESRAALIRFSEDSHGLPTRLAAACALSKMDVAVAAPLAASLLRSLSREADVAKLVDAFLERNQGSAALAKALAGQKLASDTAKIAIRTARSSALDHTKLVEVLETAGDLSSNTWNFSKAELAAFVDETRRDGNAARGEAIFRRQELKCYRCHAIAGAGGRVGPDFSSLGASAPMDYIVESLIDPDRQMKENYPSLVVLLKDGRVLTGIRVAQSKRELSLRLADGSDRAVPLASILQQSTGGSLMPAGLVSELTRVELRDLVRFLSLLGKPGGGYSIGGERVVRRWEVFRLPIEQARRLGEATSLSRSISDTDAWVNTPATESPGRCAVPEGTFPANKHEKTQHTCRLTDSTTQGSIIHVHAIDAVVSLQELT
ncbi:MAG: hypothetical protein AAF517_27805, partial [Planctomycetota bacterium]